MYMLTYTKQGPSLGDLKDMGREIVLVNFQLLLKMYKEKNQPFYPLLLWQGFIPKGNILEKF